jgi:O-antigen/teichoic acid export membrane protein
MIFLTLAQVNFSVLNGIGKPKEVTKIVVFAAVFNTVINLILIPVMGISGAALTTTLSYFIMLAWSYVSMRKNIQFKAEKSWSIITLSFIFLGLLYFFKRIFSLTQPSMSLYLEAAISLAVSFLVYAALAFLLKCITFDELKRILKNAMRLRGSVPASVPPKD